MTAIKTTLRSLSLVSLVVFGANAGAATVGFQVNFEELFAEGSTGDRFTIINQSDPGYQITAIAFDFGGSGIVLAFLEKTLSAMPKILNNN